MKVLGTFDDVHLIEAKSRKNTYQLGDLTKAAIADLGSVYDVVTPGFALVCYDSAIVSKTQHGEEILFYENKADILEPKEVFAIQESVRQASIPARRRHGGHDET